MLIKLGLVNILCLYRIHGPKKRRKKSKMRTVSMLPYFHKATRLRMQCINKLLLLTKTQAPPIVVQLDLITLVACILHIVMRCAFSYVLLPDRAHIIANLCWYTFSHDEQQQSDLDGKQINIKLPFNEMWTARGVRDFVSAQTHKSSEQPIDQPTDTT